MLPLLVTRVNCDIPPDEVLSKHAIALLLEFRNRLIEIGIELEVLLLSYVVEFVVVTLGALQGESQPNRSGSRYAIVQDIRPHLRHLRPSRKIRRYVPIESSRHQLARGGLWQEIPRKLLDGELVEGHVVV